MGGTCCSYHLPLGHAGWTRPHSVVTLSSTWHRRWQLMVLAVGSHVGLYFTLPYSIPGGWRYGQFRCEVVGLYLNDVHRVAASAMSPALGAPLSSWTQLRLSLPLTPTALHWDQGVGWQMPKYYLLSLPSAFGFVLPTFATFCWKSSGSGVYLGKNPEKVTYGDGVFKVISLPSMC